MELGMSLAIKLKFVGTVLTQTTMINDCTCGGQQNLDISGSSAWEELHLIQCLASTWSVRLENRPTPWEEGICVKRVLRRMAMVNIYMILVISWLDDKWYCTDVFGQVI